MSLLVIDVGTSSVRASIVRADGAVELTEQLPCPPVRPRPGVVEFDPTTLAEAVLAAAGTCLARVGRVDGVGVTAQRASTVLWERSTGQPLGPGIGWQDLRTVGECLALRREGLRLAPNQTATKLAHLLAAVPAGERPSCCAGTVESWVAWTLSGGSLHVTDTTNAAVTGLLTKDATAWDASVLERLGIPPEILPTLVASTGLLGQAGALPGEPPLGGLVGDQQASLVGQGCLLPGDAKATFGTGGMLDCCTGETAPASPERGDAGTFPIVAWQEVDRVVWGVEAIMLAAGSCLSWLVDSLGLLREPAESDIVAASVRDAGGVQFVPALEGIATPLWDFGARGTLLGLSGASGRAEVVRAVLEGIAQTGADLLEAVEADSGYAVESLRVDGGMSRNGTFCQLLANATGRTVRPAALAEATTLGAAYLAGVAVGTWRDLPEAVGTARELPAVDPTRRLDRERWRAAREHARRAVPALSALDF